MFMSHSESLWEILFASKEEICFCKSHQNIGVHIERILFCLFGLIFTWGTCFERGPGKLTPLGEQGLIGLRVHPSCQFCPFPNRTRSLCFSEACIMSLLGEHCISDSAVFAVRVPPGFHGDGAATRRAPTQVKCEWPCVRARRSAGCFVLPNIFLDTDSPQLLSCAVPTRPPAAGCTACPLILQATRGPLPLSGYPGAANRGLACPMPGAILAEVGAAVCPCG